MEPTQELLFDPYGLPQGDRARPLWGGFLEHVDSQMESVGWDSPPRLYLVCNPVDTSAMLYSRDIDPEAINLGPASGPVFSYVSSDLAEGHPVEALWGFCAPAWASAVVLACEVWGYPPGLCAAEQDLPPSEHPDRVEQRLVLMVTKAGEIHQRLRTRGSEVPEDRPLGRSPSLQSMSGILVDALHQVAGAPLPPRSRPTVRDLFAGMLIATTQEVHQQVRAQVSVGSGVEVLPRGPLPESSTFAYAFLGVAARLLWEFTDHGRAGLTVRQRRVISALRSADPELTRSGSAFELLEELCSALGTVPGMSWSEFFRRPSACALVAPVLWDRTTSDPQWACEEVLASTMERVIGARGVSTAECLQAVPEGARDIVAPFVHALCGEGLPPHHARM